MNCVSLSGRIIFRHEKFVCIFSCFRKIKIERNTKLKLIAYILGIMCCKISLIEAPKLVSIKQKRKKERKKEKSCWGWTENFSTHCINHNDILNDTYNQIGCCCCCSCLSSAETFAIIEVVEQWRLPLEIATVTSHLIVPVFEDRRISGSHHGWLHYVQDILQYVVDWFDSDMNSGCCTTLIEAGTVYIVSFDRVFVPLSQLLGDGAVIHSLLHNCSGPLWQPLCEVPLLSASKLHLLVMHRQLGTGVGGWRFEYCSSWDAVVFCRRSDNGMGGQRAGKMQSIGHTADDYGSWLRVL